MEKIAPNKLPRKILVIKPSSLGDVVHSLPFLSALRECFPLADIHWVIARGLEGLLEGNPMISKLWIIDKDKWKNAGNLSGTLSELGRLVAGIRRESYDITIDLQGLLRSGLITAASAAPMRIGFAEAREGSPVFYTHRIRGGRDIHAVDRYLRIAEALGCDICKIKFPLPLVRAPEEVMELKEKTGEYAVLVPGARWLTKRWPAEQFAAIALKLPFNSLIVGSAADHMIAKTIEEQSKGKAISLAGETNLIDLIWIIRSAKMVITNDSGPMHIAAACGIPVVAIFGPTNPLRTGPYGSKNIVVRSSLGCAPCYERNCKSVKCMTDITPEMVFREIGKL